MGAMGAAEPLQSVLWVKQERCAVSLEPARALLRWWRSQETGPCAPGAGECGSPGLMGLVLHPPQGLRSRSASGSRGWADPGRRKRLGAPRDAARAPEARGIRGAGPWFRAF